MMKKLVLVMALSLLPTAAFADRLHQEVKSPVPATALTAAEITKEGEIVRVKEIPAEGTILGNRKEAKPKTCCQPPSS
jgi:hypothetical protein